MQADDHTEGMIELARMGLAELPNAIDDAQRRLEGLTGGVLEGPVDTEQRERSVADELVEMSARVLDRVADDLEIAIEQEDGVEGQAVLGELGEAPQVAEQDREIPFAPAGRLVAARGGHKPRLTSRQHGHDREVVAGPQLTGKADLRPGPDPLEGGRFCRQGLRLVFQSLDDADAAGRASPTAAAGRGMRDASQPAGFENAEASGHRDRLLARIGDADAGGPGPVGPHPAANEHASDQGQEPAVECGPDLSEGCVVVVDRCVGEAIRIRGDFLSGLREFRAGPGPALEVPLRKGAAPTPRTRV